MSFIPRGSRRPRSALLVAFSLLAGLGALAQQPASAAVAPARTAPAAVARAAAPAAAAPAAVPQVSALALTGTTTRVTVRRIHRSGQARWVGHVLDGALVDVDGCQARRSTSWGSGVYRATVHSVCPAGPQVAEAAARALQRARPWYRVQVQRVPLVGFTLLAEGAKGSDRAVGAALAQLPGGPSVFAEGDDVSLAYAGPDVTQARLDAAVAAFAAALRIPSSQVTVTPLAES